MPADEPKPDPRREIEAWLAEQGRFTIDGISKAPVVRGWLATIDADHRPAVSDRWCRCAGPMHFNRCARKTEHERKLLEVLRG